MRSLASVVCLVLSLRGASLLPTDAPQHLDTIVVGLGPAGTTAASTLARAGRRVLALEAQGRVGGRVHTVPFGDGIVEIGAEWIHGTVHNVVYDLAVANNITVLPQEGPTETYHSDGTVGNNSLVGELFFYGLEELHSPPEVPESVGQFLTRRIKAYVKENYPHLTDDYVSEVLNWIDLMLDVIDGSGCWDEVTTASFFEDLEGNLDTSWNRLGYKTFFELLLNTYKGGPGLPNLEIKLNTEVQSIEWPQNSTEDVVVTTVDGTAYRARNVIVTVSLGVLKERHTTLFTPTLPSKKVTAIEKISMGVVGKIIFSFEEPWWNGTSDFGFVWKPEDRLSVPKEDQWLTKIYGVSTPMGSNNTLTYWTVGEVAKMVEIMPADIVQSKLLWLGRRFLGKNYNIPEPTAMIRSTWYANPYTRGSYSFDNVLTPQYPTARVDLGEPLVDISGAPRVLFAGEATEPKHFSTVHGASETGYREANRLLAL